MSKQLPTWLVVVAHVLLVAELSMVFIAVVIWTILLVAGVGPGPSD
jgi:hypothetical protein